MTEELKQIKYTAPVPVKKTRRSKKTVGGDVIKASSPPLPLLSTTHAVGGTRKATIKVALPYTDSKNTPSPAKAPSAKVTVQPRPIKPLTTPTLVKPTLVKPTLVKPTLVKPTLVKPTLVKLQEPVTHTIQEPTVRLVNKPSIIRKTVVSQPKIVVSQNKRRNMTLKRKFTNKRITIQIENSKKLKKLRENAEKNLAKLKPCDILNSLRKNGLVRPNANPPEALNRAMMLDIMMFPKPL